MFVYEHEGRGQTRSSLMGRAGEASVLTQDEGSKEDYKGSEKRRSS
jgi:hypothetical protein